MNCAIAEQIAEHANTDNQAEAAAEINERALSELFTNDQALFSNGYIDLIETIDKSIRDDSSFITEILCEIVKSQNDKTQTALKVLLKRHLTGIALEINEGMGV